MVVTSIRLIADETTAGPPMACRAAMTGYRAGSETSPEAVGDVFSLKDLPGRRHLRAVSSLAR